MGYNNERKRGDNFSWEGEQELEKRKKTFQGYSCLLSLCVKSKLANTQ